MTVKEFASKHRLRVRQDEDLTDIIPGKCGHIYEYDYGLLGAMVMPKIGRGARWWGTRRRLMESFGFSIRQDGDTEGAGTFNPNDRDQVRVAMQVCGIKRIQQRSPKQVEVSRRALEIAHQRRVK